MKRIQTLIFGGLVATCTAAAPAMADPTPYREGILRLRQTFEADFDKGTTSVVGTQMPGADIWFDAASWTKMFLTSKNGAQFGNTGVIASGPNKSVYNLCQSVSLTPAAMVLTYVPAGDVVCYRTDEGRKGYFIILDTKGDAAAHKPLTLRLFYRTWQ